MKEKFDIVKIYFQTPLHLSRGRSDFYDKSEEILHSDTIKSAIFVCAKLLYGDAIGKTFFERFKVSSAFPFKGDEHFFPKPMAKLNLKFDDIDEKKEISKLSKNLKKINYLSKDIFESIISGKEYTVKNSQLSKDKKFVFFNDKLSEAEKTVYKSQVQQRLKVEYVQDGTPYYIDRLYFTENSGLFFFIEYPSDDRIKNQIKSAIRLLGDEGVGTDRYVGNGLFIPEFEKLEIELPDTYNSQLLLSVYCPEEKELSNDFLSQSSYTLIKRGGFIASPGNFNFLTFRKKSVYMFTEGSVFPHEMQLKGKIIELQPAVNIGHPILRDGYAFSVPFVKN